MWEFSLIGDISSVGNTIETLLCQPPKARRGADAALPPAPTEYAAAMLENDVTPTVSSRKGSKVPPPEAAVQAALERVATRMSLKYNMSIAAAYYSPTLNASAAAGYTDAGLGMGTPTRRALADDLYVWGSTTKMFTASAVLQLVEVGAVGLDDAIAPHIDPILNKLNGSKLADHFIDPRIRKVTIRDLLHMTSGIGDYDAPKYSRDQFAARGRDFSPVDILVGYMPRFLEFAPGSRQRYCSSNYVLLGLVLATHVSGATSDWSAYYQLGVAPPPLHAELTRSLFVDAGRCASQTPVHGFMESYSAASLPPQDVWNVSCVGGWTAGNYVGSVADVARFTYALYSDGEPSESAVVAADSRAHMLNYTTASGGWYGGFYGMGTFNLSWAVDATGATVAHGHVGDTYGYQSQTTYFPGDGFALAVATNVETSSQAQPADFTCSAYHEVRAAIQGAPPPNCTFVVPHHFIGVCTCV